MAGREGGSLRHPAVLPCDVWGRGWMDMLHDGLDPIPPNSRCHGRESEFALLCLHERQAVIRDCPLPDPKGHPAGRTTAREGAVVELCVSPLKKGQRAKEMCFRGGLSHHPWFPVCLQCPQPWDGLPCSLRGSQTGGRSTTQQRSQCVGSHGKGPPGWGKLHPRPSATQPRTPGAQGDGLESGRHGTQRVGRA